MSNVDGFFMDCGVWVGEKVLTGGCKSGLGCGSTKRTHEEDSRTGQGEKSVGGLRLLSVRQRDGTI